MSLVRGEAGSPHQAQHTCGGTSGSEEPEYTLLNRQKRAFPKPNAVKSSPEWSVKAADRVNTVAGGELPEMALEGHKGRWQKRCSASREKRKDL
jgi:hypothetical protein